MWTSDWSQHRKVLLVLSCVATSWTMVGFHSQRLSTKSGNHPSLQGRHPPPVWPWQTAASELPGRISDLWMLRNALLGAIEILTTWMVRNALRSLDCNWMGCFSDRCGGAGTRHLQTTCASVTSAFPIDVIVSNGHLDLRHLVLNHPWITCHRSAILLFWEVDRFVDGWDQLSHFQPFWSIPSSPFATVTAKDGRIPPGAGHTVPTRSNFCPWVPWFFTHLQLGKIWYVICRIYCDRKQFPLNCWSRLIHLKTRGQNLEILRDKMSMILSWGFLAGHLFQVGRVALNRTPWWRVKLVSKKFEFGKVKNEIILLQTEQWKQNPPLTWTKKNPDWWNSEDPYTASCGTDV